MKVLAMKNSKIKVSVNPVPILGLMTIVFVILKALGHIDWSWWLVFAPMWAPTAVVILLAVAGFGITFLIYFFGGKSR